MSRWTGRHFPERVPPGPEAPPPFLSKGRQGRSAPGIHRQSRSHEAQTCPDISHLKAVRLHRSEQQKNSGDKAQITERGSKGISKGHIRKSPAPRTWWRTPPQAKSYTSLQGSLPIKISGSRRRAARDTALSTRRLLPHTSRRNTKAEHQKI